jgi:hypothetical protein
VARTRRWGFLYGYTMKTTTLLGLLLLLPSCRKRCSYTPPSVELPRFEEDMAGLTFQAPWGDWTVLLQFEVGDGNLVGRLRRLEDELDVPFDVHAEFFPFSYTVPSYLVLVPRQPWVWLPYHPTSSATYAPLLMECYPYTNGGTVWPPYGMDNLGQSDPAVLLAFQRVE